MADLALQLCFADGHVFELCHLTFQLGRDLSFRDGLRRCQLGYDVLYLLRRGIHVGLQKVFKCRFLRFLRSNAQGLKLALDVLGNVGPCRGQQFCGLLLDLGALEGLELGEARPPSSTLPAFGTGSDFAFPDPIVACGVLAGHVASTPLHNELPGAKGLDKSVEAVDQDC